jgi:hypothetical protein
MNVVAITGYLTADPARKETTKGVVTTFRVGSDDSPRVWVDVESWGHLAGTCAAHLSRGRPRRCVRLFGPRPVDPTARAIVGSGGSSGPPR